MQTTIRELRDFIAQRVHIPALDLCLVWQGRVLKEFAKQLGEVKIRSNDQIIAVRKSQSADQKRPSLQSMVSYGTITSAGHSPLEISEVLKPIYQIHQFYFLGC